MIKLIDVQTATEEVTFGTCDLCESTGYISWDTLTFEDGNGTQVEYENRGYWDWGHYEEPPTIEDTVIFAEWVKKHFLDAVFSDDRNASAELIERIISQFAEFQDDVKDVINHQLDYETTTHETRKIAESDLARLALDPSEEALKAFLDKYPQPESDYKMVFTLDTKLRVDVTCKDEDEAFLKMTF